MRKAGAAQNEQRVCMAEIVGVHGVKGTLKLKSFGDDPDLLSGAAPLYDADGANIFKITSLQPHGNIYLASIEGVSDRTAAEKLRGTKLFIDRSFLPDIRKKDTFYHIDLIGLAAKDPEGKIVGKVIQVANFGAGDLLEIKPVKGASFYLPFTKDTVPDVDIGKKEITVVIPEGLL